MSKKTWLDSRYSPLSEIRVPHFLGWMCKAIWTLRTP
jgi:hypothetical protein